METALLASAEQASIPVQLWKAVTPRVRTRLFKSHPNARLLNAYMMPNGRLIHSYGVETRLKNLRSIRKRLAGEWRRAETPHKRARNSPQ